MLWVVGREHGLRGDIRLGTLARGWGAFALASADLNLGTRLGRNRTGLPRTYDNGALAFPGCDLDSTVRHMHSRTLGADAHCKCRAFYGGGREWGSDLKLLPWIILHLEQQGANGLNNIGEKAIAFAVAHFYVAVRRHRNLVLPPHQYGPAAGAGYQPVTCGNTVASHHGPVGTFPVHGGSYLAHDPATTCQVRDPQNLLGGRSLLAGRFAVHRQQY